MIVLGVVRHSSPLGLLLGVTCFIHCLALSCSASPTASEVLAATAVPLENDKIQQQQQQQTAQRIIQALTPLANGTTSVDNSSNVDELVQDLEDLLSQLTGSKTEVPDDDAVDEEEYSDEDHQGDYYYADEHAQKMLDIVNDPDCMTGELDASSETFDIETAIDVLTKCGLVLLRNMISPQVLEPFKRQVTSYMDGIERGRIAPEGKTTYGEAYYIHETSPHRYDICFTPDLLDENIVGHPVLMDMLQDDDVLGDDFTMLDFGAIVSEPGAKYQHWHRDGEIYEFGTLELPPFAVGVLAPLLNTTIPHGVTEFCMGLNAINRVAHSEDVAFANETLAQAFARARQYDDSGDCPPEYFRSPALQFGDMMLFHYNMVHRGGENVSPHVRTVLYNTFARKWYKDANFGNNEGTLGSTDFFREVFKTARIGVPDKIDQEDNEVNYDLDYLEQMGRFNPQGGRKTHIIPEPGEVHEFTVSNIDVDLEDLEVCIARPNNEEDEVEMKCMDAPTVGKSERIEAVEGEEEIWVMHNNLQLKHWPVRGPDQLVLKYEYFDVCVWEEKCSK